MNKTFAYIILVISVIFSIWLLSESEVKLRHLLTSREWQTNIVIITPSKVTGKALDNLGPLGKFHGHGNIKYLHNGTYIRVTDTDLYDLNDELFASIQISESGEWELSDNYLLVNPKVFRETTTNRKEGVISEEQLETLKKGYMMDARESRRVDIINDNSLLLTSLDHGSVILSSN